MNPLDPETTKRLMDKVWKLGAESGCWLWIGACDSCGYGLARISGKTVKVNRVFYRMFLGETPDGMCVCHRCDTPSCVNPEHLFLGTRQDNMTDMVRKGRQSRGARHGLKTRGDLSWMRRHPERIPRGESRGHAKLTTIAVREIKAALHSGMKSQKELGGQFGVSQSVISMIKQGKKWSHVSPH